MDVIPGRDETGMGPGEGRKATKNVLMKGYCSRRLEVHLTGDLWETVSDTPQNCPAAGRGGRGLHPPTPPLGSSFTNSIRGWFHGYSWITESLACPACPLARAHP